MPDRHKTHFATAPITADFTPVACSPRRMMAFHRVTRHLFTSDGGLSFADVTCERCQWNLAKWIPNPELYRRYRQRGA